MDTIAPLLNRATPWKSTNLQSRNSSSPTATSGRVEKQTVSLNRCCRVCKTCILDIRICHYREGRLDAKSILFSSFLFEKEFGRYYGGNGQGALQEVKANFGGQLVGSMSGYIFEAPKVLIFILSVLRSNMCSQDSLRFVLGCHLITFHQQNVFVGL